MIRKPPADWERQESAAVKTVKAAVEAAHAGAGVARRGGHLARGLLCFFFAIIWGLGALFGGLLGGSAPTFFGVGAMAAFMAWAGVRAFAKARAASG
jgi:hypothetical protein